MEIILKPQEQMEKAASAYQQKDYSGAAQAYQAAAQGFLAEDNLIAAAEARNNASVGFLLAGSPESALASVEGTPDIFASCGDERRQALALGNLGAALEALGRIEEAIGAYQDAAGLLASQGDETSRLEVMQSLSALQLKSGKQINALITMKAGLDGLQKPSIKQRLLKRLLRLPFGLFGKLPFGG